MRLASTTEVSTERRCVPGGIPHLMAGIPAAPGRPVPNLPAQSARAVAHPLRVEASAGCCTRILLCLLLVVHGIAHTAGFVVPWKLMSIADLPYRTTIFGRSLDIGDVGVRAVGLVWLLTGALFVVVAIAAGADASWWYHAFLLTLAVSVTICVVEWPQAHAGVLANAVVFTIAVAVQSRVV